jgi:uncharacterized membrane protein
MMTSSKQNSACATVLKTPYATMLFAFLSALAVGGFS